MEQSFKKIRIMNKRQRLLDASANILTKSLEKGKKIEKDMLLIISTISTKDKKEVAARMVRYFRQEASQ